VDDVGPVHRSGPALRADVPDDRMLAAMMRRFLVVGVLLVAAGAPASAHPAVSYRGSSGASVGTAAVGPAAVGPAAVGPAAVGPAAVGPAGAGTAAVGPAGAGPAGAGPAAVGPAGAGPASAGPARAGPATSGPAGSGRAAVAYRPPVSGALVVLRRFDPPRTVYGPGHLGVDLALTQGGAVLAAAAGTVRFAGPVAGRGVVVVAHPDGVSTEYEPIHPLVARGDVVHAGEPIGRLVGTHRGCGAGCLHWGARRAGSYLDPLSLLRPLGPVRLLPW
jgi:murein DD-endopeptidase MepM/ murein hydrolase activator NlpD